MTNEQKIEQRIRTEIAREKLAVSIGGLVGLVIYRLVTRSRG
jgi:hypothetical protein